jgi:hypothetical protein
MIASYDSRPLSRPSPKPYYSFTTNPTSLHYTNIDTQTHSLPTTPMPIPTSKPRPKMPLVKKPSCSTRDKRNDVQQNLEAKVEKSKGFHAFFVPLGRSLPPAPPSSPVLGASTNIQSGAGGEQVGKDYFEDWVEDVGGSSGKGRGEAMDLD